MITPAAAALFEAVAKPMHRIDKIARIHGQQIMRAFQRGFEKTITGAISAGIGDIQANIKIGGRLYQFCARASRL